LAEGNETVTNCNALKMLAADGKMRLTDVADTGQLLRLVQSVPSPKAEPFKLWLARVGSERIDEIEDPEKGIDRLMETYLKKGYLKEWVNQRLKSIEIRKELTDEWEKRNVKAGQEFAILTDEITKTWSGFTTKQYKGFKGLKKENLRATTCRISNWCSICLPKHQRPKFPKTSSRNLLARTALSPEKEGMLPKWSESSLKKQPGEKWLQNKMPNNCGKKES